MMNRNENHRSVESADKNEKSMSMICSICGKEFSDEKRYFGHLRIHSGEVLWSCDKCPSSVGAFDSQSRLKMHENLCHTLVRPFKCSKCDNVFDRASQLDYHTRSVHLGEKSQICQICGKGFFRKTDLRTHLNVHLGTNRSICEICGRKFNHVSNLIRHCRTHAGTKPYPCTICGKRFTQISSLARHKRIHKRETSVPHRKDQNDRESADQNSGNSEDRSKVEERKIIKRQHYCRICGESFQFMILLRQHERLHSKTVETYKNKVCTKEWEFSRIKIGKETEQVCNEISGFDKDPNESSTNGWKDVETEKDRIVTINAENLTMQEHSTNQSIRDHLMELARKMNSIEIESDRDVSISISDILSPYNCDEIELSNADALEPRLYEISGVPSKHGVLEKEYDIVQCLNNADFATNIDPPLSLENSSDKTPTKPSGRQKIQLKDQKPAKSKNSISHTRDQYSKCLHVEGSQLYIEICESEYLKSSNLNALELQEIENVALFQEDFGDPDDAARSSKAEIPKKNTLRSLTIEETAEDCAKTDSAGISIGAKEPTLQLVQTETGEQFYELVVNNQCNAGFEYLDATENRDVEISPQIDTAKCSTSTNDCQTSVVQKQLENAGKSVAESSTDEFFQLVPNAENYREIHAYGQNDTQTPMVRLVQNEDGEQFFELIREPLEYERNRNLESSRDENSSESPSDLVESDNIGVSSITKPQMTLISNSLIKKDKKESLETVQRPSKDRTRKFQCTECDKWFSTAYNFKQHTGTHFSDQQKFQCKDCGLSFAWKSTLNKHLAGNHRPDGPQKFVCEICPKVYSTLSQVNEHVKRDHLKERNHVCPLCGKSFFKKFDLKTHSRTHTNERPYVCRACGKGFHHQSHIIRHERIHSGERPYACDICQRTFTQPGSLKTHRQRHRELKIDILEYRMDEDDPLALAVQ